VRKRIQRPSPALVLSLVALFVALGGTGYAAVKINGKNIKKGTVTAKQIKSKTITGGKVKANTLTGTQINESKLGTVPSATKADSATSAVTATTATTAVNATNATNAGGVSGRQVAAKRVMATAGPDFESARVAAPEVTLFTVGPFTIYGKCMTDTSGPTTLGFIFAKTSESDAILNSIYAPLFGVPSFLQPGTNEMQRFVNTATAGTNSAGFVPPTLDQVSGVSAGGATFEATTAINVKNGNLPSGNGPYGDGDVCLFSGQLNQLN
jgi:hypothetical protein